MRDERDLLRAIELYSDTVRRICFLHLKNRSDTEDISQTVFLKYILYLGVFENDAHEKAWFIRVSLNACRDLLRWRNRHMSVSLSVLSEEAAYVTDDHKELLQIVLSLPKKYKDVLYLFYYEQYTAVEISKILNKNENTIYSLLSRGRALLREQLGGDEFEK